MASPRDKSALIADGPQILPSDFPAGLCPAHAAASAPGRTLEAIEQQAIMKALSETGGRQDRAARLLGISPRTLIRKLKLYENQETCSAVALSA